MARTSTKLVPSRATPYGAAGGVVPLLLKAASESLADTGEVVAMLESLRRTSPRDYIAAMVMIGRLGQEVPTHEREYTVISAIPRSKLDDTPAHMAPTPATPTPATPSPTPMPTGTLGTSVN
jgi:hypothetical protein